MTKKKLWRTHWEDTNALYSREVEPRRFHFIEVTDMDDACGRDNAGQPPFVVELSEVDLDAISEKTIEGAKQCCGWEREDDKPWEPIALAEMCHQYGAKAPLESWTGGRVRKDSWDSSNCPRELIRNAKRRSRELDDPAERTEALMRPVNKLGSTALEYMQGDMHSAMVRGVRSGDQSAKLMAKMHGASEEKIATIEQLGPGPSSAPMSRITLGKVPSSDPLAFAMGFMSAIAGSPLDSNREELAQAYIAGYQLGTKVRLGEEPQPEWVR